MAIFPRKWGIAEFVKRGSCLRQFYMNPANAAGAAVNCRMQQLSRANPYSSVTQTEEWKTKESQKKILQEPLSNIKQRIPKRIKNIEVSKAKSVESKRVKAFCTAEEYDLGRLADHFSLKTDELLFEIVSQSDEVIQLRMQSTDTEDAPEVFFFKSGTAVFWDTSDELDKALLQEVKLFEFRTWEKIEFEEMEYKNDNLPGSCIEQEIILIGCSNKGDKLAFSNGIANSVQLAAIETLFEKHIQSVRHIPEMLLEGKKLPLHRSQVLRKLGELLNLRGHLNLYSELIEMPDLYWSDPYLGELHHRISQCLDIKQRVHLLNKKLDYANEMAQVLRNHLSEQHSLKLEWFIIILIAVEVAFEFLHFYEK